jgi:hypothetical protein
LSRPATLRRAGAPVRYAPARVAPMPRSTWVSFAGVVLCGCTPIRGDWQENLVAPRTGERLVLDRDISYVQERGIGAIWVEGLRAGTYAAELENDYGTFYRGPGACVTQAANGNRIGDFAGGIWLPKDSAARARLYYYFDHQPERLAGSGAARDRTLMPKDIDDPVFLRAIARAKAQGA